MNETCAKCGEVKEPVALFMGTRPGWSCKCEWASLERREFRQMFGFGFSSFKRKLARQPKTYCFAKSHSSGSSSQRRLYRREQIRLLDVERQRLAVG